jgi:PAS domain S-box-containing protein
MEAQLPLLPALLVLSGSLSLLVTYFVWRERPKSGVVPLAAVEGSLALWAFGQALVVSSDSLAGALVGYDLTIVGLGLIGPSLLLFALLYTGRPAYVTRWTVAGLAVVPVTVVALALGDVGALVYVDPTVRAVAGGFRFETGLGPAVWTLLAFDYAVLLAGDWLLLQKVVGSRNVYRKRTFFFLSYSVLLTACQMASVAGVSPTPHQTLAPLANLLFGGLSVLVFVGYRSYGFLPLTRLLSAVGFQSRSIAPVARNTVIEEMGSGVLVADHRNRVVDINQMGKLILAQGDGRVVGKQLTEVLPPEIFVREETPFLEPGVEGEFTGIWVETPFDERRCFDLTISALRTDGEVTGRVGIVHDTTERERRKQALEARTDELERQNEQLEGFASIVSHDLRNPLNVAEGRLELAEREGGPEHFEAVREAHERMEAIIGDVLTLARQGRTIEGTEPTDLSAVATDAWSCVDARAASLDVTDSFQFEADRGRLRQALENLFRNAVEHGTSDATASAGGAGGDDPAVTVTVGRCDGGFYVADDGPGIPDAQRDDIFERGFTTAESGTGLGLAIVQTVVEAHGWEIDVAESETGGARFEITGLTDQADTDPLRQAS